MTIHNQETAAENELFLNRQGDFLEFYKKWILMLPFSSLRQNQLANLFAKIFKKSIADPGS